MLKNSILFTLLITLSCACSSTQKTDPASQADARGNMVQYSTTETLEQGIGRTETQITEITAVVKAVDTKKRTVTVVGPRGNTTVLDVGPEVKRLNEIKPGNTLALKYYESLEFEVRPPTADELRNPETITELAGRNPKDLPPAAGGIRSLHMIVKITAIDKAAQTVTVREPSGKLLTVKAKEPKNLDKIKIGNSVAVTYTEALAIGVASKS